MEKIGIFGGTFNPPHKGHLHIATEFVSSYSLDRMLIIPTYVPPHKASPGLAPSELRVKMCRRTFTDPVFEISEIEIERKGKSYTYDTLKQLKGIYRDAELYFLCGDDMLLSFHNWYKPREILKLCTVVATVRDNDTKIGDLEEYAEKHFPSQYKNGKIQFLPVTPLPLSSTEIREKVKKGESVKGLVTLETQILIFSEGLYK